MPSRTTKQAKVMSAIAHGWEPTHGDVAKIPVKVAKEFHAADVEEIVRAPQDLQSTIGAQHPEVTRIEPAVAEHARGRLRIVHIARGHAVGLDADTADHARCHDGAALSLARMNQ